MIHCHWGRHVGPSDACAEVSSEHMLRCGDPSVCPAQRQAFGVAAGQGVTNGGRSPSPAPPPPDPATRVQDRRMGSV